MITAHYNDKSLSIDIKNDVVVIDGNPVKVDRLDIKDGMQHLLIGNKSYRVEVLAADAESKTYVIRVNGVKYNIAVKDALDNLLHELGMDEASSKPVNDIKAPMPGLVVDVLVKEGQTVKKGDTIVVLEAMKMENSLKAAADATVTKVNAKKGAAVEKNEVLVHLS